MLAVALLLTLSVTRADVLDRIVASAGQQVVTLSRVRQQVRIEALVARSEPDYSAANMRRAAERLIEQALVLREMELSLFVPPAMADADLALESFIRERKQTPAGFQADVQRLGFNEDEFRREVRWRLSVERFVNFRFAPGIQVSDQEIENYYKEEFTRQAKAPDAATKLAGLEEAREAISLILARRKTDQALEQWMTVARAAAKIRFFEEALKP